MGRNNKNERKIQGHPHIKGEIRETRLRETGAGGSERQELELLRTGGGGGDIKAKIAITKGVSQNTKIL
jgi:hypothetical protein